MEDRSIKSIKKFPTYVVQGAKYDSANVRLNNTTEQNDIGLLFLLDQESDFLRGIDYAEKEFLSKDIMTITATELEQFIRELHKRVGHSSQLLDGEVSLAGQYSQYRGIVVQETGRPNLKYEQMTANFFSQHNYKILKELYNETDAENYKDFCKKIHESYQEKYQKLSSIFPDPVSREYNIGRIDLLDIMNESKLITHPGYNVFTRIMGFSEKPQQISSTMQQFCSHIVEMIKKRENPIKIAASIREMLKIHPFPNGNGRIARILMNCILMNYGIAPIQFNKDKQTYYKVMESAASVMEVEEFLVELIQENINQKLTEYLIDENRKVRAYEHTDFIAFEYNDRFEIVPQKNIRDYQGYVQIRDKAQSSIDAKQEVEKSKLLLETCNANIKKISKIVKDIDCFDQAVKYKVRYQSSRDLNDCNAAIYYFMRAARFFVNSGKSIKNIANCYLQAADLCRLSSSFESAYILANQALKIYETLSNVDFEMQSAKDIKLHLAFLSDKDQFAQYVLVPTLVIVPTSSSQSSFYSPALFKPSAEAKKIDTRKWAAIELRDKIYPLLDTMSQILLAKEIELTKPNEKFIKNSSKTGWQLFEFKDKQDLLAILNLPDSDIAEKLVANIKDCSQLQITLFNNKKSLGITLKRDISNIEKEICKINDHLKNILSESVSELTR